MGGNETHNVDSGPSQDLDGLESTFAGLRSDLRWLRLRVCIYDHAIAAYGNARRETQPPSQPSPGLLGACKMALEHHRHPSICAYHQVEIGLQDAIAAEEKRLATKPDHAARLRKAAPEMWPIVAAVVKSKTVHPPGCPDIVLGIELPDGILEQADEVYDRLQPTENEASA